MKARFTIHQLEQLQKDGKIKSFSVSPKTDGKNSKKLPKKIPKQVSWMKSQLTLWCMAKGYELKEEHRFHPARKFRFDFAIEALKIGIEYEGINSTKSRHTTVTGYSTDTDKYNLAQSCGWKVLRFTALNYKTIIQVLENQNDHVK